MSLRSTRRFGMVASVASLLLLASCARQGGGLTSPSAMAVGANAVGLVGDTTNSTPAVGQIKVCKLGNVSGTFSVSAVPVSGGSPSVLSPATVASGQCLVVAEDLDTTSGVGANVTLSETSAGLQSISAERIDSGNVTSFSFANGGTLFLNLFHGYTITFTNDVPPPPPPPPPPPTGTEGCSPGYFKNHPQAPSGYNRTQTLNSVLQTTVFPPNLTINSGLSLKGGGVNALARHAAAAILNAAALPATYTFTLAQLRAIFDQVDSGTLSIENAKNLLESKEDNGTIRCPLG